MKTQNYHAIFEKLAANFEETRKLAGKHAAEAKDEIGLVRNLVKEIARLRDVIEKIETGDFSFASQTETDKLNFLSVYMESEDFERLLSFQMELIRGFCKKSLE